MYPPVFQCIFYANFFKQNYVTSLTDDVSLHTLISSKYVHTYETLKQRLSMLDFVHATNFVESNNNPKISRIKKKTGQKFVPFRHKLQI